MGEKNYLGKKYKTRYDFAKFKTIRIFRYAIKSGKIGDVFDKWWARTIKGKMENLS